MHRALLPLTNDDPPTYSLAEPYEVTDEEGQPRECTVDDICDFVVEYINADVLVSTWAPVSLSRCAHSLQGVLWDRLLIIAGMSSVVINLDM